MVSLKLFIGAWRSRPCLEVPSARAHRRSLFRG
jgi:hypothetical protein